MATTKHLSLIYKIQTFADTYLGKVTKFQGNDLFRFGGLSHLLGCRWNPPPPPPPVLIGLSDYASPRDVQRRLDTLSCVLGCVWATSHLCH